MATLKTTIVLRVGDAEQEYAGTITYERHKGFAGDRTDPPEPASCEITGITIDFASRSKPPLSDLIVAELEPDLMPELMEDWAADMADAEERRAEQRRDDRMMEGL
jgi:hypothetical protein